VLDFVDYNLRGVGQVVFMNNPITGLLILTGLWLTSAWLGFAATVGLVASTGTALVLGFRSRRRPGRLVRVQTGSHRGGACHLRRRGVRPHHGGLHRGRGRFRHGRHRSADPTAHSDARVVWDGVVWNEVVWNGSR
jgi:hypothetical protein